MTFDVLSFILFKTKENEKCTDQTYKKYLQRVSHITNDDSLMISKVHVYLPNKVKINNHNS